MLRFERILENDNDDSKGFVKKSNKDNDTCVSFMMKHSLRSDNKGYEKHKHEGL